MKKITLFIALAIVMSSCKSNKEYAALQSRLTSSQQELVDVKANLQKCLIEKNAGTSNVSGLEGKVKLLENQIKDLKVDKAQSLKQVENLTVLTQSASDNIKEVVAQLSEKDKYINGIRSAMTKKDSINLAVAFHLKKELDAGIQDQDIQIDVEKTVVYISIADKLLFRSGSSTVSDKAKASIIRDMFLFSVFAGGLRFGDVIELKWNNYNTKDFKITKTIRKTSRQHSIRIGQVAIDILEKYKTSNSKQDDIIFPFANIDNDYFTDREQRAKVVRQAIALSNMYLTKMGKTLEFPFSLTFHISRHTFATRALNNGMRIEHVSKLMDHSDIGITQVYAKIISSELDNAVDKYIN